MKFHITDAKQFCAHAPRAIPFAYRDKLQTELELLQSQGVIVMDPTEKCVLIVVTPKKGTDKIRMCVDLSHLNRYVKRERYQCSTAAQAVADIAAENAKIFTKLDALKGYHQCPLEESQRLTTFITPFGRYKYFRHHTVSPPYRSTTTAGWMKHLWDSPATAASSMMWTMMKHNMQATSGSPCKIAPRRRLH